MMKRYLPVILSVLLVVALAVPAVAGPFNDVPEHHWAYDAVKQLAAYGLVIGFPDGEYKGAEPMTRYQLAMVVARMLTMLDAQIKAELEAAKTVIPAEVPAEVAEQPVVEKVVETTIVEKLKADELDALNAKVAALEEEVAKGDAANAAAIAALKAEVDALEIPVVPAIPDVNAAVAEAILLIDALRDEFVTELDILNAKTDALAADLKVAVARIDVIFDVLDERATAIEGRVDEVDAALTAHIDGHEKVKISGSTEIKLEDVDIRSGNPEVKAWKDPGDIFEKKAKKNHGEGEDFYKPGTKLQNELKLTLTAYPADGVVVEANLKTATDVFGGDSKFALDVKDLSVEVVTDGVLERLYAGGLELPKGTFTPYTIWGKELLDDDDDPLYKGVVTELGYGKYSGTLLFSRLEEEKAAVKAADWVLVDPEENPEEGVVVVVAPEDYDPEADDFAYEDYIVLIEGNASADAKPAKYFVAGEGKVNLLDNLNLGVAYVRVWDDHLSTVIDETEEYPFVDQVISVAGDFSFAEDWKVDGEYARLSQTKGDVTSYASAANLNLSGVVGPATVKGEYVRVEKEYEPEFVALDPDGEDGLKVDVKTIGASVELVPLENLTLSGGYKVTGNAGEAGDWDAKKHAIAEVGVAYELAFGDLALTPSLGLTHTNYIIDEKYELEEVVLETEAAVKAEFAPIEATFAYVDGRIKGDSFVPYFKQTKFEVSGDYDVTETVNVYGGYEWDKKEYVASEIRGSGTDDVDADEHETELKLGAKAEFAVYEGISLKASYDYAVANNVKEDWKPYTKSILAAGAEAQLTPKAKVTVDGEYQQLDRFYDEVQYAYAPVTNLIGAVNYSYDITTNTELNLGYKVVKSTLGVQGANVTPTVDDAGDYLARIVSGSLKVKF